MDGKSEKATSTHIDDGSRRIKIASLITILLGSIIIPLFSFALTFVENPVYALLFGTGFLISVLFLTWFFLSELRRYNLINQPREPVEIPETFCCWCKKIESQWTDRIRLSTPQRAYCSVRCFAAGEHESHIKIAKCSFLFLLVMVSIILMQSFPFTSDKFIGLMGLGVAVSVFASLIIYMLVMGHNHRKRTSE